MRRSVRKSTFVRTNRLPGTRRDVSTKEPEDVLHFPPVVREGDGIWDDPLGADLSVEEAEENPPSKWM